MQPEWPAEHLETVDEILARAQGGIGSAELLDTLPEGLRAEVEEVLSLGHSTGLCPVPRRSPELLGHFQILALAGSGAQGEVYRAVDTRLQREVALKVLAGPERLGHRLNHQALMRLQREAQVASAIQHPGICPVYDIGEIDGLHYIAMRWLDGGNLSAWLAKAPPPDLRQRVALIAKTARALHAAHEQGVVHRDIKPGNIQVSEAGEPVVLDFGLATALEGGEAHTMTVSGTLLGTLPYCSPEQVEARPGAVDRRSDVWGLGVTLFECVSGTLPFRAPTRAGLLQAITQQPPDREAVGGLDRDLRVVLDTALHKDPDHRYQDMAGFADDLEAWVAHRPIRARPPTPGQRLRAWTRRNPMPTALIILLAASAVLSAWLYRDAAQANRRNAGLRLLAEAQVVAPREPGLAMNLALRGGAAQQEDVLDDVLLGILQRPVEAEAFALPAGEVPRDLFWVAEESGLLCIAASGWCGIRDLAGDGWRRLAKAGGGRLSGYSPRHGLLQVDAGGVVYARGLDGGDERVLLRVGEPVLHLAVARRSGHIALLAASGTLSVHPPDKLGEPRTRQLSLQGASRMALAPDGRRLAVIDAREQAQVLHVDEDLRPQLAAAKWGRVTALRFSADGEMLLGASHNNRVHTWRLDTEHRPYHALSGHGSGVAALAVDPTGDLAVTGSFDRSVMVWQPRMRRRLAELVGHQARVVALAVGARARRIASADSQGQVKVWLPQAETSSTALWYPGPRGLTNAVLGPRGTRIAVQGTHGLMLAELDRWGRVLIEPSWDGRFSTPLGLAFHPKRPELAIQHPHGRVEILDADSGQSLRQFEVLESPARSGCLGFSPDGRYLLCTSNTGQAALVDFGDPLTPRISPCSGFAAQFPTGGVSRQAFLDGGARFVTVTDVEQGRLHIGVCDRPLETRSIELGVSVTCLAATPDGARLAIGSACGTILILDPTSGQRQRFEFGASVTSLRWGPAGRQLACAGHQGRVALLAPRRGGFRWRQAGHSSVVYDACIAPDGGALMSNSFDETVALWELQSGRLLHRQMLGAPQVSAVFAPGGSWILAAGVDGQIRSWPLRPHASVPGWFRRQLSGAERERYGLKR